MTTYQIWNKATGEWWKGEAESAKEACIKAGWHTRDCWIRECPLITKYPFASSKPVRDYIMTRTGKIEVGDEVKVLHRKKGRWVAGKLIKISQYSGEGAGLYQLRSGEKIWAAKLNVRKKVGE